MWQEMDIRVYVNSWLDGIVEFIEQLPIWDNRVYWTVDYVAGDGIVEFIEQLPMWQVMDNRVYWTVDYMTRDE